MRTRHLLLLMTASLLTGCGNPTDPIQMDPERGDGMIPIFTRQRVPSSRRSQEAVARVAPALIRDLEAEGLSYGAPVFLRILKQERELELWVESGDRFQLFRTYRIAAMSGELGPKLREGDRQAPEGFYVVTPSRMNPSSRYHLAFNLGYPNAYDRAHGRTGSAIMVHGNRVSIGCFAMTDAKIEDIYTLCEAALRNGQPFFRVHVFPFRMTPDNLAAHADSDWLPFWRNLQTGYDGFEERKQPPNVEVENGRYVFETTGSPLPPLSGPHIRTGSLPGVGISPSSARAAVRLATGQAE